MTHRFFARTISRTILLLLVIAGAHSANAQLVYALAGNNLVAFNAAMPGTLLNNVAISGISAGEVIEGLDIRPATGELYALGYHQGTGATRLYTIIPATGVATPIGAGAIMLRANMGKITMDFNPTVDRIRVTGSDNSNYRLHPVTGALAATDTDLAFAANDVNAGVNPSVGTGAYVNSFAGSTTTTLYNYDDSLNILTTQIPPNNGTLNTVGASGIVVNPADPSSDLDIYYTQYGAPNRAYLAANVGNSLFDNLYTIHLATGQATMIGMIGNGLAVTDIAIALQPVENACDVKMVDCLKFELLSITKNASGDKTFRIRVTNNCTDPLDYVAIQLPDGVTAVSPANNSVMTSVGAVNYAVRNPNFSPFYSVRFKSPAGAGITVGQADIFEYTLPATANPTFIHVAARVGANLREVYLNIFRCNVGSSASRPAATERESAVSALHLFPNPADTQIFADLSEWEAAVVQVRVFNAQAQVVAEQALQGGSIQAVELPTGLTPGFYYLELRDDTGLRRLQKFMVGR
jgi:hypothetical protein